MTYTYKLARRLAISRHAGALTSLLLVAACAGETTGPDATTSTQLDNPFALRVVPGAATIETDQQIRFRSQSRDGNVFVSGVTWEATGGTINPDGTFSATEPGTYKIVGRGRGRHKSDTSVVVVVPPQPDLVALEVSPDPTALLAGESRSFAALGRLSDGSEAAVGVVWSATGGTIDAGGAFQAGQAAGSYRVVATQATGSLADTAVVTVSLPEEPTPPEAPAPPEEPTLVQVVLKPGSASLSTSGTRQFAAFGRNSAGDSVAVAVAFSATGGSITPAGLYTAGSTAGTYRVVAAASGLADTAVVTLTTTTSSGGTILGLPFGPSQQLDRSLTVAVPFTMTSDGYSADNIVKRIEAARAGKYRLLLALTGGKHDNYMSVINGAYQFDLAKWRAKMDTYNTATIRQAVADGVRDGIIVGSNVMDEPHVSGAGDGNTWGPPGTMTKARVDGLCSYVQQIFPTLNAGVFHQHDTFEPDKSYEVCQFIVAQYNSRRGDVRTFREEALALGRRDGHAVMFSINILNGGVQDKDGVYDCTGPGQGGKGTFSPNCRMTPTQIREYGSALGPAGCGLFMWRYDSQFVSDPENQLAFKDLAAKMASQPWKACRRS